MIAIFFYPALYVICWLQAPLNFKSRKSPPLLPTHQRLGLPINLLPCGMFQTKCPTASKPLRLQSLNRCQVCRVTRLLCFNVVNNCDFNFLNHLYNCREGSFQHLSPLQYLSDSDEIEDTEAFCETSPFGEWSECSTTCGVGISMRTRRFLDRWGRKKCPHVGLVEKRECVEPPCPPPSPGIVSLITIN